MLLGLLFLVDSALNQTLQRNTFHFGSIGTTQISSMILPPLYLLAAPPTREKFIVIVLNYVSTRIVVSPINIVHTSMKMILGMKMILCTSSQLKIGLINPTFQPLSSSGNRMTNILFSKILVPLEVWRFNDTPST